LSSTDLTAKAVVGDTTALQGIVFIEVDVPTYLIYFSFLGIP
jgi:hypothetical protein